jgi:pimeloyl-ACP methyl ester carboxylesterase
MPVFNRNDVQIYYEIHGSGFPLMVIPGGGLNSTVAALDNHPFNPLRELDSEYQCIAADLRNAKDGQSIGPLEVDRPWDAFTDDQLGLMDFLGIDRFMVMGFCIGGPMIWNLIKRAPDRVVGAVLAQPSGFRPSEPDFFYTTNMTRWGPELVARRPEITTAEVDAFITAMYRKNADFVFTVTRDFVRTCETPVLIMPDDITAHPYEVAMESANLAPNSEVSIYPWKDTPEHIAEGLAHARRFLKAHTPAIAAR